MKAIALLILTVVLFSCVGRPVECENPTNGEAILVAYRVAKHSHLWLKNPATGIVHDITGLGGRREPNIELGTKIKVQYCGNEIMFNGYECPYVRQAINRTTRFVPLKGYEYLYNF